MESEVEYVEAESRTVVTKDGRVGEMRECWSKGTKLELYRMNKSRELMYRMMTIVNITVVNIGNC